MSASVSLDIWIFLTRCPVQFPDIFVAENSRYREHSCNKIYLWFAETYVANTYSGDWTDSMLSAI